MNRWKSWRYKNLTLLGIGIVCSIALSSYEQFHLFLLNLGNIGYVGAFVAGILFVSTFTVATGTVILLILVERLSVIEIGLIAGAGAVLGDFIIFRFVKENLIQEIIPFYNHFGGNHLTHLLNSRYFHWTLPVLGAIIIASPLPDELGVSLMGISKLKTFRFILLSFVLNTIGIIMILSASTIIKP